MCNFYCMYLIIHRYKSQLLIEVRQCNNLGLFVVERMLRHDKKIHPRKKLDHKKWEKILQKCPTLLTILCAQILFFPHSPSESGVAQSRALLTETNW